MIMQYLVPAIITLSLLSAIRTEAHADQIQLTCSELSMASPIFIDTGGIRDTSSYNRTLEVSIATSLGSVTMSNNYGSSYAAGTFPLQITDSTYEWDDNVAYNNGFDHFILDRYSAQLHSVTTPVPGGEVIQMQVNYRCETLQKQF
jgi:hypothetical protein